MNICMYTQDLYKDTFNILNSSCINVIGLYMPTLTAAAEQAEPSSH